MITLTALSTFLSKRRYLIYILLAAAAAIPFLPSLFNGFVYDDREFFLTWEGIKHLRLDRIFLGDQPTGFHHVYRPVRNLFIVVLYSFLGSNAFAFHLISIIIHAINVMFIYTITKKIAPASALIVSIVFAVMPIHVEAINLIIAGTQAIGIAFFLLAFYTYIVYQESHKKTFFFISVAAAFIAYFTYEMTLTMPFLLILYDICIRDFRLMELKKKFLTYALYISGAIVFFIVRTLVLPSAVKGSLLIPIDFSIRMLTTTKALLSYMYLTIFNWPLSAHHQFDLSINFDRNVLMASIVLLFILLLAGYLLKTRQRVYAFAIFWFFIALLPVLNIVQIASFVMEHYLYIASYGSALIFGTALSYWNQSPKENIRFAALCATIFLVFLFGTLTWQQSREWRTDETLWLAALRQEPHSTKAMTNLAVYYKEHGNLAKAENYLQRAANEQRGLAPILMNFADLALTEGRPNEAISYLQQALSIKPQDPKIHNALGMAYSSIGDTANAAKEFQAAIDVYPQFLEGIFNLAVMKLDQKLWGEAILLFERAKLLQPDSYEVYFGLAMANFNLDQKIQAKEFAEQAIKLNPNFTPAKDLLKQIMQKLGS